MFCVVGFGACFCIYGLMSIISGTSSTPERIFTKRTGVQENLKGKKARIAGTIYLLIGIAIIVLSLIYLR
jgi:hypothetical protein